MALEKRLVPVLALLLLVGVTTRPLAAATPGEVNFQGLLLDDLGDPVDGFVDFEFRLFDADTGGTLLWSETQSGVEVVSGVYDVVLGSVAPLSSVVLSNGTLYLEIHVDGEALSPRQRLLAVPFAIRAAEADNVGGISSVFVSQIFQHQDWDGGDPPADDPREGIDDVDGDGRSNFIDPDNDGDGFGDAQELVDGTDINLVTPSVTGVDPALASSFTTTRVTITGTGFLPGLSVDFGTEAPTPINLTSTSFEVDVGPQPMGTVTPVVTNPNGESAVAPDFAFRGVIVFITSPNSNGDLGGVAGADATCDSLASAAGFANPFRAWVSDASSSPSTRFVQSSEAYTLVDGTPIADDWADLTDGSIENGITLDENGTSRAGSNAWTATNTDGTHRPGEDCNQWTDGTNGSTGRRGLSTKTGTGWTDNFTNACNGVARLYCFEQLP